MESFLMKQGMYKEKYTPGPWFKLNGSNVFTDLGAANREGIEASKNDGWMIADCDMGALSFEEVEANTRLIAHAPDLYEKLETLLLILPLTSVAKNAGQKEILQQAYDEADELLKKVAGFEK